MTQDYGIDPNLVHWNCMVDLLGWAGHLEVAKLFIDNMPVERDEATWGALGELAAKERFKLEPKDPRHTCSSSTSMLQLSSGRTCWEMGERVSGAHYNAGERYTQRTGA